MGMRFLKFPGSSGFVVSAFFISASIFWISGCFRTESQPTGPVPQVNAGFPSAKTLNAKLGRGINFGNALDAPKEGDWGVTLKAEWFQWVADSGFATVRIPVQWSAHALEAPPYTIDSVFMNRVAWAVDHALAAKLNAIIDMHHYDKLMKNPESQKARFLAMWRQIAIRFADYGPELLLEILNEPRDSLDAAAWNGYLAAAIDTIRALQPKRTLLVGTTPWGGLTGLAQLELPADSNLIVTVHYYDPHTFTHQGATFEAGATAWLGTPWRATPPQRSQVDQDIKTIADWAAAKDRPVFLGEFGTYELADSASRAMYTEYLAASFEKAGFSWALWNFSSDFGLFIDSTQAWRNYLVAALVHPGRNAVLDSVLKASTPIDLGKYLLFDDFEDGIANLPAVSVPYQEKIHRPVDSAYSHYYAYHSDSSLVLGPRNDTLFTFEQTDTGGAPRNFGQGVGPWGYQGKGLHVKLKLLGNNYPYAGFGAGLMGGWSDDFVDLTKLTAVQFRAKGYGAWNIMLGSDSIYNKYSAADNWGQMVSRFILKDQWESFIIPAEIFAPKQYSPQEKKHVAWADVRDKIISLEFQSAQSYGQNGGRVDDSLEIWIDDIRLIGVENADFGLQP
jgi:aryl-phospho-beta-D-glucosidase BglC (GH1 family)